MDGWSKVASSIHTIGRNAQRACLRPTPGHRRRPQVAPPTMRIVTPSQTIQSVLNQCAPGDIVEIQEGIYTDPIVVEISDVTIRAAPGALVCIETSNKVRTSAVTFRVPNWCCLEGVRITHRGTDAAVRIETSAPEIRYCDVSGVRGCVAVSPNLEYISMYPVIVNCKLHSSAYGYGVCLENAKAIVEKCEIYRNRDAGIVVCGKGANPWIGGNMVRDGYGSGVALMGQCAAVVCDNVVECNECAGLVVEENSNPIVWSNTFQDGLGPGINVQGASHGLFEKNKFRNNAECDVRVADQAEPIFRENCFLGNVVPAIVVTSGGRGTFSTNTFERYASHAVTVGAGSRPTITQNEFHVTDPYGAVSVLHSGGGVVQNNTVRLEVSPSVHWIAVPVRPSASPSVSGNEIVVGVVVREVTPPPSKLTPDTTPLPPPPPVDVPLIDFTDTPTVVPPPPVSPMRASPPLARAASVSGRRPSLRRKSGPTITLTRRASWSSATQVPTPPPVSLARRDSFSFPVAGEELPSVQTAPPLQKRVMTFSRRPSGTVTWECVVPLEKISVGDLSMKELRRQLEEYRAALSIADMRQELAEFRKKESMKPSFY